MTKGTVPNVIFVAPCENNDAITPGELLGREAMRARSTVIFVSGQGESSR